MPDANRGLRLPAFHPAESRHRDRFDLRPPSQHDFSVRRPPPQTGRSEHHLRVRDLDLNSEIRRPRPAPPWLPLRRRPDLEPVDPERVGGDRDAGTRRLHHRPAAPHRDGGRDLPRGLVRDRKSTRLNSSHSYISYAVFCLKKKKKNKRKSIVDNKRETDAI